MRVYLAARYPRRDELKIVATRLREQNIEVTSRWLLEKMPLTTQLPDTSPRFCEGTAQADLEDIEAADTFVLFSENSMVGYPRAGRMVEFGYALAKGKRIVVIGGHENIFMFLPEILHYATLEDFLDAEGIQDVIAAD